MNKIYIILHAIVFAILLTSCGGTYNSNITDTFIDENTAINDDGSINFENFEYSYDIEALNRGYKALENTIVRGWWKEYQWNVGGIGPSSYMMSGFLEISSEEAQIIENRFAFEKADVIFADGIYPEDTGFSNFNWCYSSEFNKFIESGRWIGDVYYDSNNKLIYVYVGLK